MAKSSRKPSRPVERAPFHRGAYLESWRLVRDADAILAAAGTPIPLIGTPEVGSVRGSNRSEITPAFLYSIVRDVLPTDSDEEVTVTLSSGEQVTASDLEALNAVPSIDHVSQHATTAHRDRRLMTRQSVTRTRYVGPCQSRTFGRWATADRWETVTEWTRARCDHAGRIHWKACPIPCPAGCKADHRHVRHAHRETGTTFVSALSPYGADGMDRQGQTMDLAGTTWGNAVVGTVRTIPRQISKRQGRRVHRESIGSWADASYRVDPEHDALGAYTVLQPVDDTATVTHAWRTNRDGIDAPDIDRSTIARHGFYSESTPDGSWRTRMLDPFTPTTIPHRPMDPRKVTTTVLVRSWVKACREYVTLPAEWARVPLVRPVVKVPKVKPAATTITRQAVAKRIASDPRAAAMADRLIAAADHALTANGQPMVVDGVSIVVKVRPLGMETTITLTRDGQTLGTGTYKARRALIRTAVATLTPMP